MTDTVEQLRRIADALEAQNTLEREIFEFNKQMMAEDFARQAAAYELSQQSSDIKDHAPSLESIREEMFKVTGVQ